jgi:nucleoside phosphorylase
MTVNNAIDAINTTIASPDIIMVGIAFGVNPDEQQIGSVLISTQIVGYDLQKIDKNANTISRNEHPSCSPELLRKCRNGQNYWENSSIKLEFGPILSGQKLVDNKDFREQLRTQAPEAIGGDMEAFGLYTAAHSKCEWIVVKAISDWADGKKYENKEQRQQQAAENAARFVIHVIKHGNFSRSKASHPIKDDFVKSQPPMITVTASHVSSEGNSIIKVRN